MPSYNTSVYAIKKPFAKLGSAWRFEEKSIRSGDGVFGSIPKAATISELHTTHSAMNCNSNDIYCREPYHISTNLDNTMLMLTQKHNIPVFREVYKNCRISTYSEGSWQMLQQPIAVRCTIWSWIFVRTRWCASAAANITLKPSMTENFIIYSLFTTL